MCESTTSSSAVNHADSLDSQASAVSSHVLTVSSQLSPLVTDSSTSSALSPTGINQSITFARAPVTGDHWRLTSNLIKIYR